MTKGRLTVVDTGQTVEFMFNPAEVKKGYAPTYATMLVPGVSHPVVQYAAGGSETITFTLWLDGDRGRNHPRIFNGARPQAKGDAIDIADELAFYESLTLPRSSDAALVTDVPPSVVLFTFGILFQAVPCVVTSASPTISWWTPDLRPMRATIDFALLRKPPKGRAAGDVYQGA